MDLRRTGTDYRTDLSDHQMRNRPRRIRVMRKGEGTTRVNYGVHVSQPQEAEETIRGSDEAWNRGDREILAHRCGGETPHTMSR